MSQSKASRNSTDTSRGKNGDTSLVASRRKIQSQNQPKNTGESLIGTSSAQLSIRKNKNLNPLDLVKFTIDPKLDKLESGNTLTSKAASAKRMFSNYRKTY
jgi:hypothetical protein